MHINPIMTVHINIELMIRAFFRFSSPGKPRNLYIATGMVVNSGFTSSREAPNSPIDIAKAKVEPTIREGVIKGKSIL
jgi:hypothetical protein